MVTIPVTLPRVGRQGLRLTAQGVQDSLQERLIMKGKQNLRLPAFPLMTMQTTSENFLIHGIKMNPFASGTDPLNHTGHTNMPQGSIKEGKKLSDIPEVFNFWPDDKIVRTDMLDYAYEIEYFDSHLVKMLRILRKRGELDNTIVIVTADNGMPFPRVKGHSYEHSNHIPLAIMWGKGITKPGRTVSDFISFIDIAPTILEAAGIKEQVMQPIQGKSMMNLFQDAKGRIC
jgi:membrane-anchored protein YejM (alkaline phosphatase superfamily)